MLIPGLARAGFRLDAVASASGLSAKGAADRAGFARTLSPDELIADEGVGLVAVATRHDSHAALAAAALRAGKAVFVEKPPGLSEDELDDLARRPRGDRPPARRRVQPAPRSARPRAPRASPRAGSPLELLIRVNAGALPPDHWLNDPSDGGGRLLGEGCHFVDLACWLVGALPARVSCTMRARARPAPGGRGELRRRPRLSGRLAREPRLRACGDPRGSARSTSRRTPAAARPCSTTSRR